MGLKQVIRRSWVIAVGVVVVIAAIIAWATRPQPRAVQLATVERGTVEASVANTRAGTIEACRRTRLSTIAGGRIAYLGVKEGDRVAAGQLLMRLWNEDQEAQSRLAEAQQRVASARVGEVCALASAAEREAARQSALHARGFVSSGREDAAVSEAESRKAACATARSDVEQAAARVRATRVERTRTLLYAPFAGTVAKIVGELGEYSTPSPPGVPTPPAIDLIDDSCLYVEAPMDEVDAPRIRPGLPVRVTLSALPGRVFQGRVRRVAPYVTTVEKQARTVDIEVDFVEPAAARGLLVGYSADVEVVLARREGVMRVPNTALREGNRVLVLAPGRERLEARSLRIGLTNWEYAEVIEGLSVGERVVTTADQDGIQAGTRVVAADGRGR